jgi:excisionase family DNA binding protein
MLPASMSDSHAAQQGLLDYGGAAALLGLKTVTLYSMVSRREVPHIRLGRRLVRFDPVELRTWLRERAVPASPKR